MTDARTTSVNAEKLSWSLLTFVSYVQKCTFPDDLFRLNQGFPCSKPLRHFDAFGLIRVSGRLTNADIPYAHKRPLLFPARNRLTTLLIDHHHSSCKTEASRRTCTASLIATRVLDLVNSKVNSIMVTTVCPMFRKMYNQKWQAFHRIVYNNSNHLQVLELTVPVRYH